MSEATVPDSFDSWVRLAARTRLLHYGFTEEEVTKAESDSALMDSSWDHMKFGCNFDWMEGWTCTDDNDVPLHPEADALHEEAECAQFFGDLGAYAMWVKP